MPNACQQDWALAFPSCESDARGFDLERAADQTGTRLDQSRYRSLATREDDMAEANSIPETSSPKLPLGDVDAAAAEVKVTPLESALAKWEKYFTPEEQAALRAYESEQGTFE